MARRERQGWASIPSEPQNLASGGIPDRLTDLSGALMPARDGGRVGPPRA